jgi:nucleoside-diphosphate-sugar epimerase
VKKLKLDKDGSICIFGGTGNIGRYLISELQSNGYKNIQIFTNNKNLNLRENNYNGINLFYGSYNDENDINKFLVSGSVVINLLYINNDKNLIFAKNLSAAILDKKIRKLIHLSSSDIIGRSNQAIIDETSDLLPFTKYAKNKLEIESIFKKDLKPEQYVILRCNSVMGGGTAGLKKLINQILKKNKLKNFIYSCFHNKRPLHLIHVFNVVSAIIFFINNNNKNSIYYLSQDHEFDINYLNLQYEIAKLTKTSLFPKKLVIDMRNLLKIGLLILGKNSLANDRLILGKSIRENGFDYPIKFFDSLIDVINEPNK